MFREQLCQNLARAICGHEHPRLVLNDLRETAEAFEPLKLYAKRTLTDTPAHINSANTSDLHY